MKKIILSLLAITLFLSLSIANAGPLIVDVKPLKIKVVSMKPLINDIGSIIKTKITNQGSITIKSCYMICVIFKDGEEVDFTNNLGDVHPLKPGKSRYVEFWFNDTKLSNWDRIGFKIKSIRY